MNYKCIHFFLLPGYFKVQGRVLPVFIRLGWPEGVSASVQSLDFRALGFEGFRLFMGLGLEGFRLFMGLGLEGFRLFMG